jgi:hypothetical protein
MDALMPLASVPTQISGRNRAWRRVLIDAIRHDPDWHDGEYRAQPGSLRVAAEMNYLVASNPVLRQKAAPTLAQADAALDAYVTNYLKTNDANNVLYAFEASRDYDPGPGLERITAPLVAINSADDLVNPPELGILEREIARVPRGKAIMIPLSDRTAGHGTHTLAVVWKEHLKALLDQTAPAAKAAAATIAGTSASATIAGKWTLTSDVSTGGPSVLDIKVDGTTVSGTLNGPSGNLTVVGEYKDATLVFSVDYQGQVTVNFIGKLQEDGSLAGTLEYGQGPFNWKAVR